MLLWLGISPFLLQTPVVLDRPSPQTTLVLWTRYYGRTDFALVILDGDSCPPPRGLNASRRVWCRVPAQRNASTDAFVLHGRCVDLGDLPRSARGALDLLVQGGSDAGRDASAAGLPGPL